ncbi:FGGY-family carbohydrate kinase [Ohessyouella blattaphilus]|uniref:FGGY-family carbohydrate kinase n=1 Tax=Ohessyouella blattaphilus TaxID=2949333 RepID=A0ABT1EDZ4_9FIRM|nr:FGGY-family carbohydrate kinase [Ohessyouella blattaphilus]MCP1108926.1 FGGY-family carbohydrate kinase [Ohessyouella blattaphilus]MCR8562320.1 FGGY-family carbohydrate kinase [Ohessyouella blattaphilus]MDL2249023.1 FGGY-family carbohydrate kinase [Lachnospiraceae bacterium OttesenSCG-928-J05]
MGRYLIGLDYGTGGGKACIIDEEANVLAYAFREYPIYVDRPSWSEHDPNKYWPIACEIIKECLEKANVRPEEIQAIGISSAQPCLVMVDEEHNPINRAYNLMDRRAVEEVEWLRKNVGVDEIFAINGNRIEDHPAMVNIMWEKKNRPETYKQVWKMLTIDAYVRLKMTGKAAMSYSHGGFWGVAYDIKKKEFNQELMDKLGIEMELMPELFPCEEIVGHVTEGAAKELGLVAGIPVCAGQVDCNAGFVGGGAISPGDVQINLGTCGVMGVVNNSKEFIDLVCNDRYTTNSCEDFISIAVVLTGGQVLRYLRDNLCQMEAATAELMSDLDVYDLMNKEAEKVPAGCEGLIIHPYLMGERTVLWDVYARGTMFGLSMHHTKGHIIRAMMEGVAYALYDNYRLMLEKGIKANAPIILNEGGAKSRLWRRIITDVFNVPTAFVENRVGAPLGDAILAGVSVGIFPDFSIAKEKVKYIDYMEPDPKMHEMYMEYFEIYRNLYQHVKTDFADLYKVAKKYEK